MPPNDAAALADAFVTLAADPALVAGMGEAARARVLDGFTERDVMEAVKRVYAAMLDAPIVNAPAAPRFIRAHTRLLPVPHAPEIVLHVADEATELWQKTEEELGRIGPAAAVLGLRLGRRAGAGALSPRPSRVVRGRRVLDFACGLRPRRDRRRESRRRDGRGERYRCLRDRGDRAQRGRERRRDRGARGRSRRPDEGWDAVLAGDIFYERDIAERVTEWLSGLARRGATVLIGDPGRSYLPTDRLERLATYEVPVTRALEDSEVKKSSVWRFHPLTPVQNAPASAGSRRRPRRNP